MKVKTSSLVGQALDWAVAKACEISIDKAVVNALGPYHPSTDWNQCGLLISKFNPDLMHRPDQKEQGFQFAAWLFNNEGDEPDPIGGH